MIKVLLNNQRKIIVNTLRTRGLKNYISYLISFAFIAVVLFFICQGIWKMGSTIEETVLTGALSYGFLIIIGFIVLLGLPQVFKHLYAATDLGLLFTLPIPTRHIFWIKYFQSFIGIPLFAFGLFLAPLVTYGIVIDANIIFYPILIIVLLAFALIGLSIAYLFNLILIQIVPASKANELMTIMSVFAGLFVYLMFMIPNLANNKPLTDVLLSGLPLFPDWVPVSWGSVALTNAASGSLAFILPFVLLILLAVFSVVLTASLVEKGFRTGWIRLSEGGRKKKVKKKNTSHGLSHPVVAVGKKEWYSIKRDMREWLVFMPMIFFIVFPLIGFFSGGAKLSDLRGFNEISWPIAQAAFLFLYAIVNGSIASSSIGREGDSVWILRTLPLPGKYIALGKLWISWLMPLALLTIIECIVGIFLGWTVMQFVLGIAMKAVITMGISAIGLWLGTMGAKYHPTNPQARLKFGTSIIQLVLAYVYLSFAFIPYVLLMIPIEVLEFASEISAEAEGIFGVIAGIVATLLSWKASNPIFIGTLGVIVMLLISLGIAAFFTVASARRIDKGIEIDMVSESTKPLFKNKGGSLY